MAQPVVCRRAQAMSTLKHATLQTMSFDTTTVDPRRRRHDRCILQRVGNLYYVEPKKEHVEWILSN
jgi:hypothetical protein